MPLLILGAAIASTATGLVPVAVAFFAGAVLMVASGALPIREIYGSLDAPILLMLAALISVSEPLRTTLCRRRVFSRHLPGAARTSARFLHPPPSMTTRFIGLRRRRAGGEVPEPACATYCGP